MNFHDFFKNIGFRLVFCKKSKILYISATKWGCPIASYLPIARLGAAIRITDCIVPDWFPDSIYWPESLLQYHHLFKECTQGGRSPPGTLILCTLKVDRPPPWYIISGRRPPLVHFLKLVRPPWCSAAGAKFPAIFIQN